VAASRKKAATKKRPAPPKKSQAKAPAKPAAKKIAVVAPPPAARPAAPPPPPAPPPIDHAARLGEAWQRLEAYVAAIGAPPLRLAPGASARAIAAAEKEMKLTFPPDFRASLLLHDGQVPAESRDERRFPWMPGCGRLAPLAEIVAAWQELQRLAAKVKRPEPDPNPRLKGGVHRTGRIPIAALGDGATFLDLDPGPAGAAGQLVTTVGKRDLVVIDTGFGAALERWVSALERGIWVYDAEKHTVLPKAAPLFQGNPAGLFSKR
jgi:cell wall assembly regulator SMI1